MSAAAVMVESSSAEVANRAKPGKYLTFSLAAEEYGVPVLKVREIIKMMDITVVPQVPHYVRGVINLRGKVITVVDLRLKFGFPAHEQTDETAVVVVEVKVGGGKVQMGIVVDSVSDVLNIQPDEIEDTPAFGDRVVTDYLCGMAKVKGRVKILLDLDRALGWDVHAS
ncbi:MAG: chemotaxis protein CheW [Vicinamibacterales bacterium]|nr:chemotaxis protein CheW [Vicinamibacterales bacterium]